ncbi:hypothetical protein N865_19215 [Intrasporangium oryzae NRRL B-24470]|uniref:Uncharacterized protein n=1 Tax=Intrasporangium oryzae NRRL B-24470 TaxID=1386089 RepID=W9GHH2_9MICO|nr:hypothetical protein [Intrasporangium oryzae]EWT03344.1 hypothetical protein N865_19215 [Intrasporangium oryzae NRRL B-24470]
MAEVSTLQLSLSDVARLAGVRRPVVSMWRTRELAGHPFPKPVALVAGQERFDAFEIADYLATTGRGNNPEARDDLAAHAQLTHLSHLDETTAADGLTALLCLAASTGEALGDLDHATLVSLASDADSADAFLLREVEALGADLPMLAAHAEALADASYSPAAAFELLLRQQLQRSLRGHASVALRPEAQQLVAQIAAALANDAGMETPLFVDVTDGSADLVLATARAYAAESPPSVATVALDSRSARLARRRLRVHDLHRLDVLVDEDGDFSIPSTMDGSVHVLQLPPAGQPGLSDVEMIDAIGNLLVQLADNSRVVVLGPASALTDPPSSPEADSARDAILRSDRLRAAVRLPKGLLIRSPRKPLALYALGPAHPDVPVGERWTVVADVSDRSLDPGAIDDLVTDVVAAMASEPEVRRHAFRFARRMRTAALLPGRKALVGTVAPARRMSTSPDLLVRIDELTRSLGRVPLSHLRVEAVAPLDSPRGTSTQTLGEAVAARVCRIVPGNRVDPADLTASDGRRVIGTDELLGTAPLGSRRVDTLDFAGSYPAARFTEPGDVVFCTTPRVAALVDDAGGSVVVTPARVLRVVRDPDRGEPPLLPAVLAADIRAAGTRGDASSAKDWRRWAIRHVPKGQLHALANTLEEVERERHELRTRLGQLDALAAALTEGVTAEALTITARPTMPATHNDLPTDDTPATPPGASAPDEEGS